MQSLVQIYITERQSRGEGILMITKFAYNNNDNNNDNDQKEDKMNVAYLTASEMPQQLLKDLLEKKKKSHKPSMIYFYVCMSEEVSFWLEYDLDG